MTLKWAEPSDDWKPKVKQYSPAWQDALAYLIKHVKSEYDKQKM